MKIKSKQSRSFDIILAGIALLAAFLNIYDIWSQQYANSYYTAAVTSMLQSFHNFFFASFDPAGFVTVDKPPVALWIQTAFAFIFGVNWSVILPQALAGVGSVLLIYSLIKPTFGKAAARLASLVMACTPIAVAVSRTNNIDSLLVFTLLLAAWMLFRAVRSQKISWLLGAFALIGVGFNIKMMQAYMVLPAFYLFYLLAFRGTWKKKLAVLAAATVIVSAVSVSWAAVVDAIPEENRPYVGGSQTNSVLELAFAYNGIERLMGMGGGGAASGGAPTDRQQPPGAGSDRQQLDQNSNIPNPQQPGAGTDQQQTDQDRDNMTNPQQQQDASGYGYTSGPQTSTPDGYRMPGGFNGGSAGAMPGGDGQQRQGVGGMFGTGQAGPLRLFQSELSGQASWLLPFVFFACVALLAGVRRRKPLTDKEKETFFWLVWLLPVMAFFSIAGFFHHYYLIMLAPPIAALTGAGWVELCSLYRSEEGWKKRLLPVSILFTTFFELYILQPYQNQIGRGWLIGVGVSGVGLALLLLLAAKKEKLASLAATAAILALLAAPLYWSATPLLDGDNSSLPQARPNQQQDFGQRQGSDGGGIGRGAIGGTGSAVNTKLLDYVTSNNTGEAYLFMTTETSTAQSYIIQTGEAVIAMGGFSGSDPILTVEKLEQMIADKKVKYFLIPSSGAGGRGGSGEVVEWIRANGTEIPAEEWQADSGEGATQDSRMGMGNGATLYEISDID